MDKDSPRDRKNGKAVRQIRKAFDIPKNDMADALDMSLELYKLVEKGAIITSDKALKSAVEKAVEEDDQESS